MPTYSYGCKQDSFQICEWEILALHYQWTGIVKVARLQSQAHTLLDSFTTRCDLCVKPDVHQFTSHLFAYEMKMKHVLKLQLKTLSFSNNFYRHYALVIMDNNLKTWGDNYLKKQHNCLRTQKWWISPASCQNKAIIMLFCFFWSFEQIEKGHVCNKRRSLCKSTFVIWADMDLHDILKNGYS